MDSRSSTTYLTVAAVTLAAGLAAYAVYFDYKRRNDVEFRKQLKKEKKRVQKSVAQSTENVAASTTTEVVSLETLREVLQELRKEEAPKTPEEKETYFMTQVGMGEQLAAQGSGFHLPAAMAFFRALRVYPSPVELIVIYQKTIPEPVFKLVMDMTNLDVQFKIEAYYEYFPPKRTNVSVITRQGTPVARQVLVVNKDFAAGEVIYKEHPIVTALDTDLQSKGTYCAQCLRAIDGEISLQIKDSSPSFPQTYCSKACMLAAKNQTHTLLFTLDSPLPEFQPAPIPPAAHELRRRAQAEFANFLKKEGRTSPLLIARFVARQIVLETQKLTETPATAATRPSKSKESDFTDAEDTGEQYTLADHIERFRYLEVTENEEEKQLITAVLQSAMPGLEEFIAAQRHTVFSGKMAYNAFGVCYGGGRDDKPDSAARPEDLERTRTPYGTHRQIGSALYTVSSYLNHSCHPSARPSFSSGTAEISIIANRDLKKGDELTIAYVDVTQHPGESTAQCRRRRRFELARGWRFACTCERCAEEGASLTLEEKGGASAENPRDESKIESTVSRFGTSASANVAGQDGAGDVE